MAEPHAPPPRAPWPTLLLLLAAWVVLSGVSNPEPGGSGGLGGPLGNPLLLIAAGVVGFGVVIPLVAYLVLRWRAGPPAPEAPGEWWTCPSCGAANIVGSPRCHSCGTWQR